MSSTDFILKVEETLKSNTKIISKYWNDGAVSLHKFQNAIVDCTLKKHMSALLGNESSGFMFLLNAQNYDDLKQMFLSFCRVADGTGVNAMAQIFREFVRHNIGSKQVYLLLLSSLHVFSREVAIHSTVRIGETTEKETIHNGIEAVKQIIDLHAHVKVILHSWIGS